jgi:hypothetical protein
VDKRKDWRNTPVEEWNTNLMLAYIADRHAELYGVDYVPYRSWTAERGMVGNLIGTKRKPGTHSTAVIKRFIDECMREYRPTSQYPGISFGFMKTYKGNVWQRVLAEEQRKQRAQVVADAPADDIIDWL